MRRILLLTVCSLWLAACADQPDPLGPRAPERAAAPIPPAGPGAARVPEFQAGVVVARFAPGVAAAEIARSRGAVVARELRLGIKVLRVPEGRERIVAAALSRSPGVLMAELSYPRVLGVPCAGPSGDCELPTDAAFGRRWDLHNDGTIRNGDGSILLDTGPAADADMDWLEAYDLLGAFTQGAVVGVVDTGIFPGHEDLSGRLLGQYDPFNIDDIAEDDHGHGTHVSGIIMAHGDNGLGGAGVAWGPNIRLLMAKGCGNTIIGYICWSPDIADGIAWAVDQGAAVINLSLGGETGSAAEQSALQYALANDVLPVCAAGNDEAAVDFPGAFPECMAVAASTWDDTPASYTSRGPEVEVAAPGGEILRSDGLDRILSTWVTGGYAYLSGTSMASPQVAGLAGLLHALGVTGAAEKRALIRATADDRGAPGRDDFFGDGRINVHAAVLAATGGTPPPPPPPPSDPPVADFTWSCDALDCAFTDLSTADAGLASWSWDFGDGGVSPVQHPSHSFPAAGSYDVELTVEDAGGATAQALHVVTVEAPEEPGENLPPTAAFTWACSGPVCDFTDTSTDDGGVVSWLWTFSGEGWSDWSDLQNPTKSVPRPGTYMVELLVEDADQALDYTSRQIDVTEPPPTLTASTRKDKGRLVVDLAWSAWVTPVDLYRDGEFLTGPVPVSSPTWSDVTGERGKVSFTYVACLAGTSLCSDPVVAGS